MLDSKQQPRALDVVVYAVESKQDHGRASVDLFAMEGS